MLPGLILDDLGDEVLQDEDRITAVLAGLYEAGVASGGVVIMDVGINPAHVGAPRRPAGWPKALPS